MHRLFVALRPPPAMRERLLAVAGGIAGARWQDGDQLHLTLRFVGEVDARVADDIVAALHGVRGACPDVAVAGVGAFASKGRPTSLWAAVPRNPALEHLHGSVGRAMERAGVAPHARAFLPHITLARLPRSAGPVDAWLAETAGLRVPTAAIGHFTLYESMIGATGASYEAIARYPLG